MQKLNNKETKQQSTEIPKFEVPIFPNPQTGTGGGSGAAERNEKRRKVFHIKRHLSFRFRARHSAASALRRLSSLFVFCGQSPAALSSPLFLVVPKNLHGAHRR